MSSFQGAHGMADAYSTPPANSNAILDKCGLEKLAKKTRSVLKSKSSLPAVESLPVIYDTSRSPETLTVEFFSTS